MSTISFGTPIFLALPLVFLLLPWLRRRKSRAMVRPLVASIQPLVARRGWRTKLRKPVLSAVSLLTICLLSVGAADPYYETKLPRNVPRHNVVLALDVSRSMATEDFPYRGYRVPRLAAVASVVEDFLTARKDDRFGLVIFGSFAALQAPLTSDHALLRELIAGLRVGIVGDGTAMGDGLGLSAKALSHIPEEGRVIILITDGVSTAGSMNPVQAATVAHKLGITVYTIGVGTESDKNGFDAATLIEIAKMTDGQYFHATSTEGLRHIYQEIDSLQTTAEEEQIPQFRTSLSSTFAWWAGAVYGLYLLLSQTIFRRVP